MSATTQQQGLNVAQRAARMERWVKIQSALSEKFGSGGVLNTVGGKRLDAVIQAETAYGAAIVEVFYGHHILESSFFEFFAETLEQAALGAFRGRLPDDDQQYTILYLTFLAAFRSSRAAAALKDDGYPLRAYSLLRDLKDRAIHLGAVVNGFTDILAVQGFDPTKEYPDGMTREHYNKLRDKSKREQSRVMKLMVGEKSGLEPADMNELAALQEMYHEEVHGSRYTFFEDLRTILVQKKLPVLGPKPHHKNMDCASFMNRGSEISWMILRCLPYLQLGPAAFGSDWAEKWRLLDGAHRVQVEGLGEDGKPIGFAFCRMMDAKFVFDPETHYEVKSAQKPSSR